MAKTDWRGIQRIRKRHYRCGHCKHSVASQTGLHRGNDRELIHFCPNCDRPTYLMEDGVHWPDIPFSSAFTGDIEDEEIAALYDDVCRANAAGAFTAAACLARAIVARLSVERGAAAGPSFSEHVEHLRELGLIESFGDAEWREHIRSRHDRALHDIRIMLRTEAGEPVVLLEEALTAMEKEE